MNKNKHQIQTGQDGTNNQTQPNHSAATDLQRPDNSIKTPGAGVP
jgi:hypothetical protein